MKVTVENKKGLNKDLKVFIDKKTMNSYVDKKYDEIKGTVNLKCFRPGKVPREILKRQFGQAVFSEVLDKVLKETSTKALEENKIKPAGQPKLDLKTYGEDKDLEYVLSVTELPKVDIKSLRSLAPKFFANSSSIFTSSGIFTADILQINFAFLFTNSFSGKFSGNVASTVFLSPFLTPVNCLSKPFKNKSFPKVN